MIRLHKDRLRKLVRSSAAVDSELPLIHNTDTYALSEIVDDGKIVPQQCKVFGNECINYMFYGRPSFPPNLNEAPLGLKHYFPVCLILKIRSIERLHRVFPFDTGAFSIGLYEKFIHKKMKVEDFGLDPDLGTPGKVVSLFFGSNAAYLRGQASTKPDIDQTEFEAHSFVSLINDKSSNTIDARGSTIEAQSLEEISLSSCVAAVILPSSFLGSKLGRKLEALGIESIPYQVSDRTRPNEHMGQIYDLCLSYYIKSNIVSKEELA